MTSFAVDVRVITDVGGVITAMGHFTTDSNKFITALRRVITDSNEIITAMGHFITDSNKFITVMAKITQNEKAHLN